MNGDILDICIKIVLFFLLVLIIFGLIEYTDDSDKYPGTIYIYDKDTHKCIDKIEVKSLYETAIIENKDGSITIIPDDPMTNETKNYKNAYYEYDAIWYMP